MMLDRFSQHPVDPLALMSNVSHQQHYSQSSTTSPSTYVPTHLADNTHRDSGVSPIDNLIENLTNTRAILTQSYKTFLPQTNNQLRTSSNTKNQATVQDGRVMVQNVQGRQNRGQRTNPHGGGAAGFGGVQNKVGNANPGQARQNSNYYKDKMLLMQAQENGVALDEEQLMFLAGRHDTAIDEDMDEQPVQDLALNVDNVFQDDDCGAFNFDVDQALAAQTMFMANLLSADPVNDEAGPSYDSGILSEVQDHDHYQDTVCAHHEEHAMHDNVQLNHVVDSHADYTSDINMIPYDQYVKDNAMPVVHNNVSYIPNIAYMMIYNDMYEPHAQSVSKTSPNTVVENSLATKFATYKEQVELYERRAGFELTEREQKINEQLRLVISDRNFKKETLKKELHSVKLQLASTINHNKLMVEEVTSITRDFKQKENKYLEDFLDMKSLKEKVDDRLFKQDQSFQTVHMLCRPKPCYKELNKIAIGYKNPLCLTRAKQENFEGIQKALTKEIKEMKDVFEELEAECLSKEVFSVTTNSKLNVARFTEMHVAHTIVEARCLELEAELSNLHDKSHNDNHDEVIDSQITQLTEKVTVLQAQNDSFRAENDKIKQHYKELYNSIKITCAKHIEQVMALKTKNVNLKGQILDTVKSISKELVKPKVLAPGKYVIDVEPIVPRLRNNREAHLDYLRHLKESVETVRDIIEEAKVVRPLDNSHQRDKKHAPAPLTRKKQVTFAEQCDKSHSNTHKHVVKLTNHKTNVYVPPSTGVNRCTDASGSQPRSNIKKHRISPAKGVNKMQVEEQPRTNKSHLRTSNCVDSSSRPKRTVINSISDSICQTCKKCLISANHDMYVVDYLQSVVTPPLFVIIVMLCVKLSKFGNLSKLGKYGNPHAKSLPALVINGDPLAGHLP
nr:hypothetical protein [Tanacetum cinerariifolium]GEW68943.1 hypothetical protein [Tanacetum cinerariifolium]